ncbi:MAG: cysteine hydrolase family protein [Ignavibacteria bacterium]|nr:cysteine hydrolase family protein [Ignavibacteria bacterium]
MKALLIIDIQNDYFDGGRNPLNGSMQAAENAKKILDKFRNDKLPVIYIQHIALSPSATFFLPDTKGSEIHELVKPLEGEKIFVKHFPNSFRETGLLEYLRSLNISELVVCGMMTHMCVDATVRAAKDFGFDCTLIGDACATKDMSINDEIIKSEYVHKSFLAALNYFYSKAVTADIFLQK